MEVFLEVSPAIFIIVIGLALALHRCNFEGQNDTALDAEETHSGFKKDAA